MVPIMKPTSKRLQGVVLPLVLIIGLLLSAGIFTFVRRSIVDGILVANRDNGAAAMALARGGVQIGTAVLYQQRYSSQIQAMEGRDPGATLDDFWAQIRHSNLTTEWGGSLVIEIEDAGARLNLNSLVPHAVPNEEGEVSAESQASEDTEEFLVELLRKIISEIPPNSGEELVYDERELARNLIDYLDADDVAINGRNENDYYLSQNPPHSQANGPILSMEEVAMIEGFDARLAEAMKPYITVYPLFGEEGINLNTAPSHVLSLIYHGSSGDMRLASEAMVGDIMQARETDRFVCSQTESDPDKCISLTEVGLGEGGIFPPVTLPQVSLVFKITSRGEVNQVAKTVEAVIDLTNRESPQLLSWKSN
ncbi:MAG: hypothetical protein CL917_03090 [Deltaproteobacteria bacterium]|nr:hypothetical protein [Deltaproteobacteria bacterium]